MKEGIQSAFVNAEVKEYGCYFLCLVQWALLDAGRDMDTAGVLDIHRVATRAGMLGDQCYVKDAAGIYNLVYGSRRYKTVQNTEARPPKTGIICQKKPMYCHFVLLRNGVIWDSLDPKRPGAAGYKPDSYRVLV